MKIRLDPDSKGFVLLPTVIFLEIEDPSYKYIAIFCWLGFSFGVFWGDI